MHRKDIIYIEDFRFARTGEERNKYFLILSDTESYLDITFVFTTSKTEKYASLPESEKVLMPAGTLTCLEKDTLIDIRNIHKRDRQEMANNIMKHVGVMPDVLFGEIIDKILASPFIKPYLKRGIRK